jgi:hypothetical protein
MTKPIEHCVICDEPTGKAGPSDDSLYATVESDRGEFQPMGPLCQKCFDLKQMLDSVPTLDSK